MDAKLLAFAALLEREQRAALLASYPDYPPDLVVAQRAVHVKPGRKYTKIDVGTSGKYMVDAAGNIWGIKAYGVIHRGHHYGTLDTIHEWSWGGYHGAKKPAPVFERV